MSQLEKQSPARAEAVRSRVRKSVQRLSKNFPGDAKSGILDANEESRFAEFGNDEVCPVLDPQTGLCELYEFRPITCRVFGPPVRSENGLGVCELCYHGATDEEIAACEMKADPENTEEKLVRKVEKQSGVSGETIVAFCVR